MVVVRVIYLLLVHLTDTPHRISLIATAAIIPQPSIWVLEKILACQNIASFDSFAITGFLYPLGSFVQHPSSPGIEDTLLLVSGTVV